MNNLERKMVDALIDLRKNHNVVGIKAEFEAEGTRLEEALRLKEVVTRAGLNMTIKIGGCEALKDMYDARSIGVDRIVAPMIESAYALKKYINAAKMVFPEEELKQISLLANIETKMGYENFPAMLKIPEIADLDGIVLGRVDMCGSLGGTRNDCNTDKVFEIAKDLFTQARKAKLKCVVGGGVGKDALPFLRNLPKGCLDRYETRKVIFRCPAALGKGAEDGMLKAVGFELMWLNNKRNFYGMIYEEDRHRIQMLEARYKKLLTEAGMSTNA